MKPLHRRFSIPPCYTLVKRTLVVLALCVGLLPVAAHAEVIFEENFNDGLGQFTASGRVYTGSYGLRLRGGATSQVTSASINTSGITDLSISFNRTTTGLDSTERAVAAASADGGAYVVLESVRSASGRISIDLPSSFDNASNITLRFSLTASSFFERVEIDDIVVSGTGEGGGGGGTFPPADPGSDGPFAVDELPSAGPGGVYTLFLPAGIEDSELLHPVVIWGNGTTATPQVYRHLLTRLASHGFVVAAPNTTNVASGTPMLEALDWVLAQHNNASSDLYGRIDSSNIGISGHSQGGYATNRDAAADSRFTTHVPIQGSFGSSGNQSSSALIICGTLDTIVPCSGSQAKFDNMMGLPVMYAEQLEATHINWINTAAPRNAMSEIVTAWMRVELMDDDALRSRFYGPSCGYCQDSRFSVMRKNLGE